MEGDGSSVTTLDNGTVLYKDGSGAVVYAQDNQGNPVSTTTATGSAIVQQFTTLLTQGAGAYINALVNRQNANTQLDVLARQQQLGLAPGLALPANLGPILLLAGLGFLAFKVLKG